MTVLDVADHVAEANRLAGGDFMSPTHEAITALDDARTARLEALIEVLVELSSDALYGADMIPEEEFLEYAERLALSVVSGDDGLPPAWPLHHVDWAQVARSMRADYTSVNLDGVTYLVRS